VSVVDTLDRAAKVSPASLTSLPASTAAPAVPTVPALLTTPSLQGAPIARGPAIGPPYQPLTSTPTNVTPGTSGEVPPGGRNYAAP
jgi:hypothetical protein